MGIRTLSRTDEDVPPAEVAREPSLARIFLQGAVVNVLNPKTALFFLAFLPQFVDPARGSVAGQAMLLGLVFVVLGLCTDGAWALLAGSASGYLREHAGFRRGQRYVAGTVYLGLGVATAVSGRARN